METTSNVIQADGLVKRFGSTTALNGLDLTVPAGTVLGLLGPNGAGKTTTVRILATLLKPDGGTATIAGHDVVRDPQRVRTVIGLTGQYAAVDESLTGRENLIMVCRLLEMSRPASRRRTRELLERFELADAAGRSVQTYSGGMRRRLDVAMSLVGRPSVLFLDEPTTGLDPRSRGQVWDLVAGLVREGTTVLLTTQYLEEADQLADRIVVIDRGAVVASGTAAELKVKVGGQSLQVRPVDAAQADAAAALVTEVAGAPAMRDREGTLISAALDAGHAGNETLTKLIAQLDEAGIEVSEIGLRLASLDDVFMALTGHDAQAGGQAA